MENYVKAAKNLNKDLTNATINVREYNGKTVVFAVDPKLKNRSGLVTTENWKGRIISNWFLISAATAADFDSMRKKLVGAQYRAPRHLSGSFVFFYRHRSQERNCTYHGKLEQDIVDMYFDKDK